MKFIAIFLVKVYKKYISPLKKPACKYYPSCSSYSLEAFKKHGLIKGLILSIWRVLRCNPWSNGGVDFVPEKFHIINFRKNS